MKNLLFIVALLACTFTMEAQISEKGTGETKSEVTAVKKTPISKKIEKAEEKKNLKAFELQITKGGIINPTVSANIYLNEKYILRVIAPSLSFGGIRNTFNGSNIELRTFLERRNYVRKKSYLSYGPEIGFSSYTTLDENNDRTRVNAARAGFNFGGGVRLSDHVTVGTYVNPYVSFSKDRVALDRSRIFAGVIQNFYLAYRF